MTNADQLSFEQLLDWLEGRLEEADTARVAAQVAQADAATHAQVAWLRDFLAVSATTTLAAPPAQVRDALRQRFAAEAERRRQPSLLRRVVATLSFNSVRQTATAGVRGGGTLLPQQLIFTADAAEVALNMYRRLPEQQFDVHGQIFWTEEAVGDDFSVYLLNEAGKAEEATPDELGEFHFQAVTPGVYRLVVRADQLEIEVAPLELFD